MIFSTPMGLPIIPQAQFSAVCLADLVLEFMPDVSASCMPKNCSSFSDFILALTENSAQKIGRTVFYDGHFTLHV